MIPSQLPVAGRIEAGPGFLGAQHFRAEVNDLSHSIPSFHVLPFTIPLRLFPNAPFLERDQTPRYCVLPQVILIPHRKRTK